MQKTIFHTSGALLSAAIQLDRVRTGHDLCLEDISRCADILEAYWSEFQEGQKTHPSFLIGSESSLIEGVRDFRRTPRLSSQDAYRSLGKEIARLRRIGAGGPARLRESAWLVRFCLTLHRVLLEQEEHNQSVRRQKHLSLCPETT